MDLAEVDRAATLVSGVGDVVTLSWKPGQPQQKILCFYTNNNQAQLTPFNLERSLHEVLPSYMIPKGIKIEAMPVLVNGKIDRQALLAKYEESQTKNTFTFSEFDLAGHDIQEKAKSATLHLLKAVALVVGDATHKPCLSENFFDIGGDSVNMVRVISILAEEGYTIGITDFLKSANLAEIATNIITLSLKERLPRNLERHVKYTKEDLQNEQKEIVIDIVSRGFVEKEPTCVLMKIPYEDIEKFLRANWLDFLQSNLSFVTKDKSGMIVGACLNLDARYVPNEEPDMSGIGEDTLRILEFIEVIEKPVLANHIPPEKGKFIHTFMLATVDGLSAQESVEVVKIATKNNLIYFL